MGDGIEHPDLKPFSFAYDPFCPSAAIEITRYNADSRDAGHVARELILILESFHQASHARLVVPVDKSDFIGKLAEAGFEAAELEARSVRRGKLQGFQGDAVARAFGFLPGPANFVHHKPEVVAFASPLEGRRKHTSPFERRLIRGQ